MRATLERKTSIGITNLGYMLQQFNLIWIYIPPEKIFTPSRIMIILDNKRFFALWY